MSSLDHAPAETIEADDETAPAGTEASKRDRRLTHIDVVAKTATITASDGTELAVITFGGLTPAAQLWCALYGAAAFVRNQDTIGAGIEKLDAGDFPKQRETKVAPWRQAVAAALVAATKKSDTPLTLEQATEKALSFDKAKMATARRDPAVMAHYHQIVGATDGVLSLL